MPQTRTGAPRQAFLLSPDPAFYCDVGSRRETRRRFNDALDAGTATVVLSGDIGAGKTLLLRETLARLASPDTLIASVVTSQLDSGGLLQIALTQFGCAPRDRSPDGLAEARRAFLERVARAGQRALLAIDEAQNLGDDALVTLGDWVQAAADRMAPFQVCLVGQRELNPLLQSAPARELRRAGIVYCPLGPIDADEIRSYIRHRLATAGWTDPPRFTDAALETICQWTRGVPRKINSLCSLLLMPDAWTPTQDIGPELVDAAIRTLELGFDPYAGDDDPAEVAPSILCVAGGIGDYVKAAAVWRELRKQSAYAVKLVSAHAGASLHRELGLFDPLEGACDVIALNVPAGATDSLLLPHRLQSEFRAHRPTAVIVFAGSPVAFLAATLARREGIQVIHVGGGMRLSESDGLGRDTVKSTDELADLVYATDPDAVTQLRAEGYAEDRAVGIGSLLADTLSHAQAQPAGAANGAGIDLSFLSGAANGYALVRLSHPANVESRDTLIQLVNMLRQISDELPLVWSVDRRVVRQLEAIRSSVRVEWNGLKYLDALAYGQFTELLRNAVCVITDSWNLQEEAVLVGTPCVTIGRVKERDVTSRVRINASAGMDAHAAVHAIWKSRFDGSTRPALPELWDGRAASRLSAHLLPRLPPATARQDDIAHSDPDLRR